MKLKGLIGKTNGDLEREFGFNCYIETKDKFVLRREVNHEKLINLFFEFIKEQDILVIKTYDGEIEDYFRMDKEKIKENLLLFEKDKGEFYDEDFCVAYLILGENFFCYALSGILMFSSNEENVNKLTEILDRNGFKYHEPHEI